MTRPTFCLVLFAFPLLTAAEKKSAGVGFQTSDRCVACHNDLATPSGKDVSIGVNWRASMMANSSRDPYWQASVRRESIDHAAEKEAIEDECSVCHMPIVRYEAMVKGKKGQVFSHLPFDVDDPLSRKASDGVSCSVCHQISPQRLGTRESFNGGFVVEAADSTNSRAEYGPYEIDRGQARIMNTSTRGFQPSKNTEHIQKSELCATCHTLFTTAFGPDGKVEGSLPEQVPYQEWLNSDFRTKQTCQDCHMPRVEEPAPITRVFGIPREGVKQHVFVAANFFMQRMLGRFRDDLQVETAGSELASAATATVAWLKDQAARVSIENVQVSNGQLTADVVVENLGGHKLPTAYPSRRCWLHVTARDADNRIVFESGALRPDGTIAGNDNDSDPKRFEPHYSEIRNTEQVQIYEDILGDTNGAVTTGLLTAVRYLKDNRLLPHGFDKNSADKDIAVVGDAAADSNFTGNGHKVRYVVNTGSSRGPIRLDAELCYQPIGYRWANNLKSYSAAPEPRRFTGFFEAMASQSAEVLARSSVTR